MRQHTKFITARGHHWWERWEEKFGTEVPPKLRRNVKPGQNKGRKGGRLKTDAATDLE